MMRSTKGRIAVILIALICLFSGMANGERAAWDCPECGRKGNAMNYNYCGGCGCPAPWVKMDTGDGDLPYSDAEKKARIIMPYGLKPGMTVQEADGCMQSAGFQTWYEANEGKTIYYGSMIIEGAEAYSTLMSVFDDGVIHVIHFFLESPEYSRENPGPDYLRIQTMLKDKYGSVSYSKENNGSDGWVNESVEVHFGYMEANDTLYYVLSYWYLPEGIEYNGF